LNPKAKRLQDWIAEERIEALMITGTMPEDKRASWCHTKRHQGYKKQTSRTLVEKKQGTGSTLGKSH